jgi:hypothetical protein
VLAHASSRGRCDGFVKESLASALLEFVKLQVVVPLMNAAVIVFVVLVDVAAGRVGALVSATFMCMPLCSMQPLHRAAVPLTA